MLTVYSLLFTAGTSIFQHKLTKFHAVIVSVIVASPLTIYLTIYSICAMLGGMHRLEKVLGKGNLFRRLLVLFAAATWVVLTIYSFLPQHVSHFSQESCQAQPLVLNFFLITPITSTLVEWHNNPWLRVAIPTPLFLTILAWVTVIFCKRHVIWLPGEPYRVRFWRIWRVFSDSRIAHASADK